MTILPVITCRVEINVAAQKNSVGFFRLLSNATIHGNSPRLKSLPCTMKPAVSAGFPQTLSTFLRCCISAYNSETLRMMKSDKKKRRSKRISIFTPQNYTKKWIFITRMIRLALILDYCKRSTVKSELKCFCQRLISNLISQIIWHILCV